MEKSEATLTEPEVDVPSADIHWKQLWSLAALYGSVIIGWIAYENYQPRLLVQFAFTDFTFLLMAAQGIILIITPMVAGKLGDRYRFEKGHRLPIISSGISIAAMIFMAVAFTLLSEPGEFFRWLLPILIVLWLIAMSIFTSPALSTVELFTPVDKLPHAMAILTITGNLVYALEPVIVDIIDYLGAPLTFIAGGVAVLVSGYALKKNSIGLFKVTKDKEAVPSRKGNAVSSYSFIFFLGLSLGLATAILFNLFPDILGGKLHAIVNTDGKMMIVGVLLVSALLSWPMSSVVNRYGMAPTFWISLAGIIVSTASIFVLDSAAAVFILAIIFSIAFTSLSVSSLPLAIKHSGWSEKVFCVGIFFSGVAVPEAIWQSWLAWL